MHTQLKGFDLLLQAWRSCLSGVFGFCFFLFFFFIYFCFILFFISVPNFISIFLNLPFVVGLFLLSFLLRKKCLYYDSYH